MKFILVIVLIGWGSSVFAQIDTLGLKTQELKSIIILPDIEFYIARPLDKQTIHRKDIVALQPEDLGQLLQKFAGVSLKSYGGLGGLKTFSFRSLGSQHTATVVDGFFVQNTPSGQLNLGQIQTSNLESASMGAHQSVLLTPVSSLVLANELSLNTFESAPIFQSTKVQATLKLGSFGQLDNYVAYHLGKKRVAFTVHGKYRQATGNYPYQLQLGNFQYTGTQVNNQLKELYSGVSFFVRPTELKQPVRLIYRNLYIDQGLPGAVVLYNASNRQYLNTQQHSIDIDWSDKWSFMDVRYYASYQHNVQRYDDSSYLNTQGYLSRQFYQNSASLGWRFQRKKFGELLNFYGGLEQNWALLNFSDGGSTQPIRWNSLASAGFRIDEKKYTVDMRLNYQFVQDQKQVDSKVIQRNLFSPYLNLETKEKGSFKWKIGVMTSTTTRLPSFNELFYAQVGNQDLVPERVRQFVLSNGIEKRVGVISTASRLQLYFNQVENKILSIPTKNLFVWSIQNIGRVNASGLDFHQVLNARLGTAWLIELSANYSFQRSVDRTDEADPNYGFQIAYIPKHTANADMTVKRKNTGVRLSTSFIGERYSLNENIPANLLTNFTLFDGAIFHQLKLKDKHELYFQLQVKNIVGENYTYVRSFVMPGRNYLISLSYAL